MEVTISGSSSAENKSERTSDKARQLKSGIKNYFCVHFYGNDTNCQCHNDSARDIFCVCLCNLSFASYRMENNGELILHMQIIAI
jgi:hypothetical protein